MFLRKNNILILLLLIFTSCGNNRVDNLPRTAKSNIIQKLGEEADIIKNNVHILSWAYYLDQEYERWYISLTNAYQKVNVYSLMPIKNGNAGWATVGQNVAQFNLENETITIDYIADNYDYLYYDIGWQSWNTNSLIQSDIAKIRNSTVNIKWWFFQAPNGYWYIINKSGQILRFSSKLNSNDYEEYDWIDIDMDNFKPIFFIENGMKKVKFYNNNLNQMPIANAGSDKTVTVNETVTINGSGTDSDGYIVSYEWKRGSEVLGTSATLNYTPTKVGTDTLTLIVTDEDGATDSDTIKIIVKSNEPFFKLSNMIIHKNLDNTYYPTSLVAPFWNRMMFATVNNGLKSFSTDNTFSCKSNILNKYVSDITYVGTYNNATYLLTTEGKGDIRSYSFSQSIPHNWKDEALLIKGSYFRVHQMRSTGKSTVVALDKGGWVLVYYNVIKSIQNGGNGSSFTNGAYQFSDTTSSTGDMIDKDGDGKSIIWIGRGYQLVTLEIPDYDPNVTGGTEAPWWGNKVSTLNETLVNGNIIKLHLIGDILYVLQKEGYLSIFDTSTGVPTLKDTINLNEFKSDVSEWTSLTSLNTNIGRTLLVTGFNKALVAFNISELKNPKHIDIFGTDKLCWNIIGIATYSYKSPIYLSCDADAIRVDLSLNNTLNNTEPIIKNECTNNNNDDGSDTVNEEETSSEGKT